MATRLCIEVFVERLLLELKDLTVWQNLFFFGWGAVDIVLGLPNQGKL